MCVYVHKVSLYIPEELDDLPVEVGVTVDVVVAVPDVNDIFFAEQIMLCWLVWWMCW